MYDELSETALAARLGLPKVHVYETVTSTMDVAHELAATHAESGTLVIANAQSAGRGRSGNAWRAHRNAVLCTLIERPPEDTLDVLSLRVGLYAAAALDPLAGNTVRVKWPNDLYLADGKLAGILVEVRWMGGASEWAAVAMGVNVEAPPDVLGAAGLPAGVRRVDVLDAIIPAMRAASRCTGLLTAEECDEWRARDWLAGVTVTQPVAGVVAGLSDRGELLVRTKTEVARVRSGGVVAERS